MKWILVQHYVDLMNGAWFDEYVSEDGTKGKIIFDDGSIEIFDIAIK